MSTADHPSQEALSEPIRVALVITDLEVGGAEKCLTQLALHLDRAEFATEIYVLQPQPQGDKAALVQQLEAAGVLLHFLNARSAWSIFRVVRELRRHFLRQRPQVVQTFLYHANVVGILAARLAGIRLVFTGIRVADPNPYRRQIERWLYGFAALNLCVSRSAAEAYRSSGFELAADPSPENFWRRKLSVIPNAVDATVYDDSSAADLSKCGFGPERQVLLFVGRLDRQKGLDWLFACLPDLFARLPDHELVIVGDGPQRDFLMRQGVNLGVADHVHFLSWRPDVPQLLKRADVLLLPSRYEGMPNAVLEAMVAGVPVVATRVEGTEEILGNLADACLVEFGRSHDLIERVVDVATNPALRDQLIAGGKERIEQEFSIDSMVKRYQQVWALATSATAARASYPESP
jgi:starch synthase (maltosyl-transferring)